MDDTGWQQILLTLFRTVRQRSEQLTVSLSPEDMCVQSMPDASPTKWHLAHTTWFFETIVLQPYLAGYQPFNEKFAYLFNSYYESLGSRHPRPQRGLLTRPSIEEIYAYRAYVDNAISTLLSSDERDSSLRLNRLITLGLHHEQQHQELILTDILHAFSCNPLLPAYDDTSLSRMDGGISVPPLQWLTIPGGIVSIGQGQDTFAFDNETPRHRVLLSTYQIASRLVTCEEFANFIAEGGYQRPEFWLSDGWATVKAEGWKAPLYWIPPGDSRAPAQEWQIFGLAGVQRLQKEMPVSNISFFEACAYAAWANARLPTEFEWEAASQVPGLTQCFEIAWQWTRSSYDPYPGFRPLSGALGEYNGKFMVGQIVLRGGSLATPTGHSRHTYRNFFPPAVRWQFSGIRLARNV